MVDAFTRETSALSVLRPFTETDLQSLAARAYARIREAIVAGSLAPGQRISERGLAAALDISAQPVREALRRLEVEGMVETRPRSGTYVADLGRDRLFEIGLIRATLEAVSARLAAERATAADHAAMRARLEAIAGAMRSEDAAAVTLANEALHDAIHAAAASRDVTRLLEGLRAYDHLTRERILSTAEERATALAEHQAIVEAIIAGEPQAAEAAMKAHALRSLSVALP
ncbi:GntR family transcriptional regulator [Falsiroseomonas ponticola]|uniref:GntR family transcriptional regulator n=1 Tax=Falsiroseomonas ponticola TaxID=2786951 RepID=UPI001934593C|nr:GntR family transcriptional regulator [Roseomonas ponticola]